jgi:hypothetical protein
MERSSRRAGIGQDSISPALIWRSPALRAAGLFCPRTLPLQPPTYRAGASRTRRGFRDGQQVELPHLFTRTEVRLRPLDSLCRQMLITMVTEAISRYPENAG